MYVHALDAGDDGFHEIQLNGKQLVFLWMATTFVSIVIFLCGVLVGRGVQAGRHRGRGGRSAGLRHAGRHRLGARPARSPAGPGAGVGANAPAPSPHVPPWPRGRRPKAPSRRRSATRSTRRRRSLRSLRRHAAAPPKPIAPVESKAPPKAEPTETAKPKPAPGAGHRRAAGRREAGAPAAPARPAPAPAAVAATAPAAAGGKIAVQVGAFETRSEADALAKKLSGKGYAVYMMAPTRTARTMFRVRVGNYTSPDEAQRVSAKRRRRRN